MNVLFLVEGGRKYGLGHLTRCAVLIEELKARGVTPVLAVRTGEGGLSNWALPDVEYVEINETGDMAAAERAEQLVRSRKPDWAVVDGYGLLGTELVSRLQRNSVRVAAFDDTGTHGRGADMVINQNRYSGQINEANVGQLFGPQYALVDPAYSRDRSRPIRDVIGRIIVTFGGTDQHGLTKPTVDALCKLPEAEEVDVVVGPYHKERTFNAGSKTRLNIHQQPRGLAELFQNADVVISAAGSTCWQACCAGLPLIAVQTADNQRDVVRSVSENGCALTWQRDEFTSLLRRGELAGVFNKLNDRDFRQTMVAAQQRLVDGHGASRIAAAMGA